MAENMNITTQAQQQTNATQAATGAPAAHQPGRMFTQDEVNQIVSERLSRERAKAAPAAPAEPSAQERREQDLIAREEAMTCREYITDQKLPSQLLEIFPTSDAAAFKDSIEKLLKAFPQIAKKDIGMRVSTGAEHGYPLGTGLDDQIASAFARKD